MAEEKPKKDNNPSSSDMATARAVQSLYDKQNSQADQGGTKSADGQSKSTPRPKKGGFSGGSFPDITSPEALIMGLLAISLDLIGYVLLLTALDDFWLTDIVGVLFIGSWVLIRGGGTKGFKGKKGIPGLKNFGIASLIEVVPYVGSISPSWSVMVYKELKNNP